MRRLTSLLASAAVCLLLSACGSSTGGAGAGATRAGATGAETNPAAPVLSYLRALDHLTITGNVSSPTGAVRSCLERNPGEDARKGCLAQVIRSRPASAEPSFTATQRQLCASLTDQAAARFWRLLARVSPSGDVALFAALAGGTHYPPTCLEALRDLQSVGAGLTGARAVMDDALATTTRHYSTLKVAVVSQSGDHAFVRVEQSTRTVPVVKVGGVWRIAALAGT